MDSAAHSFIILARHLACYHDYKRLIDMYRCAFDKQPELIPHYSTEFHIIFTMMNEELDKIDDKLQIFINFHKALLIYPNEAKLFNDLGIYLLKYEYYYESMCNFERAMKLDGSFTEDNLDKAKRILFPRRHFRVLNDSRYNAALKEVVKKSVETNTHVVVISRVGLPALYVNDCNPASITILIPPNVLDKIAYNVIQHSKAKVDIINNLVDINLDLNKPHTVVITDFDSGLFSEGMLDMVRNIKKCDLNTTIPCKAEYYIAGIRSKELIDKYRLNAQAKMILNLDKNVHISCSKNYGTEDVMLFKDMEYVTEEKLLFKIDFNDYKDVYNMLNGEEISIDLLATKDGEIDAIIGWINIYLTDEICITNNPNSVNKSNAWPHAVFANITSRKLRKTDTFQIPFQIKNGTLSVYEDGVKLISPECLSFLNDSLYLDMVVECVKSACVYLGQTVDISEVDIIDLNDFPIFGILMLIRGADSLTCLIKNIDEEFLKDILIANDIQLDKVTVLNNLTEVIDTKYHVIFHNILLLDGDIDFKMRTTVYYLKQECLIEGGLCLPEVVNLMGQLISSNTLEIENKVDESIGYNIAKYVNRYQTLKVTNIDITRLEFQPLSDVFKVDILNDLESGIVNTIVNFDGECNGALCWYEIQLIKDWKEVQTNRSNSFVNSSAFLFDRKVVFRGDEAYVLKCVNTDMSFKLVLDMD